MLTRGRHDITVQVCVVDQLEAAGQREAARQLNGIGDLPLVDQVVRRPAIWKVKTTD